MVKVYISGAAIAEQMASHGGPERDIDQMLVKEKIYILKVSPVDVFGEAELNDDFRVLQEELTKAKKDLSVSNSTMIKAIAKSEVLESIAETLIEKIVDKLN